MWYDADIDALMTRTRCRPIPAGRLGREEALAFGLVLVRHGGVHARPRRQLAGRGAARLHHLLLCRRLYDVAEALDADEHRHRRRGRRAAARRRLRRGDRRGRSLQRRAVRASSSCGRRRISGRWRWSSARNMAAPAFPCCPMSLARTAPGSRSSPIRIALAPIGVAPYLLGFASPVYGVVSLLLGAALIAGAVEVYLRRGAASRRAARRCASSSSPSSICRYCSWFWWSRGFFILSSWLA